MGRERPLQGQQAPHAGELSRRVAWPECTSISGCWAGLSVWLRAGPAWSHQLVQNGSLGARLKTHDPPHFLLVIILKCVTTFPHLPRKGLPAFPRWAALPGLCFKKEENPQPAEVQGPPRRGG